MNNDCLSTTVDMVCEMLMAKQFEEVVVEIFRKNRIDGTALLLLSDSDLKELGIVALGDRKKIQKLIEELPKKRSGVRILH